MGGVGWGVGGADSQAHTDSDPVCWHPALANMCAVCWPALNSSASSPSLRPYARYAAQHPAGSCCHSLLKPLAGCIHIWDRQSNVPKALGL